MIRTAVAVVLLAQLAAGALFLQPMQVGGLSKASTATSDSFVSTIMLDSDAMIDRYGLKFAPSNVQTFTPSNGFLYVTSPFWNPVAGGPRQPWTQTWSIVAAVGASSSVPVKEGDKVVFKPQSSANQEQSASAAFAADPCLGYPSIYLNNPQGSKRAAQWTWSPHCIIPSSSVVARVWDESWSAANPTTNPQQTRTGSWRYIHSRASALGPLWSKLFTGTASAPAGPAP
eukprot:NODE_1696_length_766_cov_35.137715_g1647_i0.p1 GENE.NODE_1696_length_766_cov_35.137715_g1647_i0~~NODE_1696_length_766_cov_35.137715_g1647_i0.p1  ORF type:complete len:229 (+),score=52.88 NODE_1696_length_766_cov_35.137715_g1647_i0:71-757(+)